MEITKLNEILKKHEMWLDDIEGGERANLRGANLRDADLSGANLSGANLRGADLRYANLRYANLSGANLRGADMRYADLRDASLRDADLSGIKYDETTSFFALQCPEKGSFVAYKKIGRAHV